MDEDDDILRARAARRGTPFLNTEQAAAYLGLSERKLRRLREGCKGPRYRLHGRLIRYHIDDLLIWSRSSSPRSERNSASGDARGAAEREGRHD